MEPNEFAGLINEANAVDQGMQAHADAAAAGNLDAAGNIVAPVDETALRAAEWLIIPQTLAWAITAAMPETAPAYTEAKCMELAKKFVPVAEKYGWNGPGESPELGLILCGAMFCAPGFMAFKARKAAAAEAEKIEGKAAPAKAAPAAGKAVGETTLQPINGSAA